MPSDRSRRTDGLRDGYTGVVAQQGRVTLDRDANAEHGFLAGRIEVDARDVIGPCGTPDEGFAITLPTTSPPTLPLWSPPPPLSPPALHDYDFLIGPGTMYVGGQRATFPPRQAGQPITYSYDDQPDRIPRVSDSNLAAERRGRELVFLALAEQEVGAVEDPDLLDVALGGPDTTQRLRLLRRVERETVRAPDCTTAWDETVALWRARDGLVLDPAGMQLRPELRLQVGFSSAGASTDPCDPIVQGGYLGAENQTIRVQIGNPGSSGSADAQASLLWGYDNASFLYRATPLASNATMLTISPPPPDAFHVPQTGQVVEILRTTAVLAAEEDATDPTGQRRILRCIAEPTGLIRRLTQPYGPANPGDAQSYIVLDQPLPADWLADMTPLFLRVWQSEIGFDPAGDTILLTDDVTGASTGVEVMISVPKGEVLTAGAYWLLALRPSTPQAVYPERLLASPQPPDGPRLWACPLAVIDWAAPGGPSVTDCRNPFDNLVTLTRRRTGCCTVALSPVDLAAGITLQQAADHAALLGQGATLCLSAGAYLLPAPLRLTAAHANLTIEACDGAATLSAPSGDESNFSDGLIVLAGASGVTLRGLALQPAVAPLPQATAARLTGLLSGTVSAAAIKGIVADMRALIGVHAADSPNLTLAGCTVTFARGTADATLDLFGAGLFVRGNGTGLKLLDCTFTSLIVPSFNQVATAEQRALPTLAAAVTSPPTPAEDFSLRMLELARSSLATIAANTAAADVIIKQNVLVTLVGCLATYALPTGDVVSTRLGIPCALGDATLRGNSFDNLTMALYGIADAGTMRIEQNAATACLGGFWLQLIGWLTPSDPKAAELFNSVWQATEAFTELQLLDGIGPIYPLPQGYSASSQAPAANPASFFVLGNQVEPVPAGRAGSTALLLLANLAASSSADTSVSLVIANNRLRSRCGPGPAAALLLVPAEERTAITGNLILTETPQGVEPGPSLWLVPDSLTTGSELLSVVGNVMQGRSNLSEIFRAGLTPSQTWVIYNAIPA
jgi:hypothetical protein